MPLCDSVTIIQPPTDDCASWPTIYAFTSLQKVGATLFIKVELKTFGLGNIPALSMQVSYTQFNLEYRQGGSQTGTLIPDSGNPIINVPAQPTDVYSTMFPINPNLNTWFNGSTGAYRLFYRGVTLVPCGNRWDFSQSDFQYIP